VCGIAGKVDFAGSVDPSDVARMCAAMEHRGPDSRGLWCSDGVAIGMQRLAIIDVAGGDQPIFNEDRSVAVVLNGEIYNFQELRADLVANGHTFRTGADTEVIVHLYEEYGDRLVERLRGMFAFALWDVTRRRLLLARDRVGKKPLFVAQRGGTVSFASEMMALLQDPEIGRVPDEKAIASYLTFHYVPHPLSAFAGVEKLPPATTMTIDANGTSARRYWSLTYGGSARGESQAELEEEFRRLLWEATRIRLISEVPLGAFLSGGIDSSAVVAAMAEQSSRVTTFSIGFTDRSFDELSYARIVAELFATDHHEFVVEPDALEIMPALARHYGEPFADPSAIPSFFLAKLTSDHVTVALNGDGGDESFAGYGRYTKRDPAAWFDWAPASVRRCVPRLMKALGSGGRPDSVRAKLGRFADRAALMPSTRYAYGMSAFPAPVRASILQPEFLASTGSWRPEDLIEDVWRSSSAPGSDRMLDVDVNTYLPCDLLVKMDIATMAHSVEARSPFLDHHMMEFAAGLPVDLKLAGRDGKILVNAALRGILPDEILDRRKMGFGVPLGRWFREDLRDVPGEMLLGGDTRIHRYVDPRAIATMISEHQAGSRDHSLRLWTLLQLESWHREVVESPRLSVTRTGVGDRASVTGVV
jgi:asparagine synthase (glutamine-hydrolysing)